MQLFHLCQLISRLGPRSNQRYPFKVVALRPPYYHIEVETKWSPFRRRYFQTHFFNENARISVKISLKFVLKCPINNIPALVQIMAWRRPGDKPLSETMMVRLPTHICVTRPQWVNTMRSVQSDRHFTHIFKFILLDESYRFFIQIALRFVPECPIYNKSALIQAMAWPRGATGPYLNQ